MKNSTEKSPEANVRNVVRNNVARKIETDVNQMEVVQKEKVRAPKITTEQKVENLKISICEHFGILNHQLNKFTIAKLANSSKRVNLVDFHKELIVELVTKPETLNKIRS